MKIIDLSEKKNCSVMLPKKEYSRDHKSSVSEGEVLEETTLAVYINERLTLQMVCTACDLPALIVGHLYSEGMITSVEEIESIYICQDGIKAKVYLTHPMQAENQVTEIRACDCGANGILGRKQLPESDHRIEDSTVSKEEEKIPIDWIFGLIDEFAKESPLHEKTHGTHSSYLSRKGILLYKMEDIGRHNALDKVIGYALMDHVELKECVIFTSGRVPTDMIQKVIRSHIPVLVSNAVPTDQSIRLAHKYGVRLLTSARKNQVVEYLDFVDCNRDKKVVR